MQWHFLKEDKWCLKHLKMEYFQSLGNQNNQNIRVMMLNMIHLVMIRKNEPKN